MKYLFVLMNIFFTKKNILSNNSIIIYLLLQDKDGILCLGTRMPEDFTNLKFLLIRDSKGRSYILKRSLFIYVQVKAIREYKDKQD